MTTIGDIAEIISTQWLVPGTYNKFDPSNAIRKPREMPRSLCLFGQIENPMFNPGLFNTRIAITSEADAKGLFGQGSMLNHMWVAAKKNAGLGLRIYCVPLQDDPTATANVRTITVIANAGHGEGELALYIAGTRIGVGVVTADTDISIAAKLFGKINKDNNLPVTATLAGAVITLTAKFKGPLGGLIDLRQLHYSDDRLVAGVGLAIASVTGGAVNPNLTAAITNMRNVRDTEWVMPYTDSASMTMVEAELLRRWSHEVQTDVQCIVAMRGSEAGHTTWLNTRNSPLVHSIHTTQDLTSPWVTAAIVGAVIESMAMLNPCTPHTGAALVGYVAAQQKNHFEAESINNIMLEGGSSITVAEDGTAVLMRMVTNYTTHNTGAYDTSMRELTWIKDLSWFRWYRNAEFNIKSQGFLLGEYAETIPGQKIMTYQVAEDMLLGIYDGAIGIARMQNRDWYQKSLVLQIDGAQGRLKVKDQPVLMNALYQTAIISEWAAGHV